MKKILDGNTYNVNLPTFYVESDDEINLIPNNVEAGAIVEVNEPGNFHAKMKLSDGTWNDI